MNIFEALRESHELQREILAQLVKTSGDTSERAKLFKQIKLELSAHERAEERHFYIPIMTDNNGIEPSRHGIAEHHEIDEIIELLDETDPSSPAWLSYAKNLQEKVLHHLEEEEHKFFQMAGKILSEKDKESLSKPYLKDYQQALAE
ncbi:hemerythrin domain-containing protein [Methylobacillus gramineus]|uniref:hemerythrin domain-containing protein n=1 Tax=Methylobacillus gramineus TaxID=755169 RepID=UPI001CFFD9BE|nr:hemerythrin domain-containing protein [Methylobacillus gramineus]MCB5185025.1 hemerythrin domain-containing protein [Methylobacillus gramineus]